MSRKEKSCCSLLDHSTFITWASETLAAKLSQAPSLWKTATRATACCLLVAFKFVHWSREWDTHVQPVKREANLWLWWSVRKELYLCHRIIQPVSHCVTRTMRSCACWKLDMYILRWIRSDKLCSYWSVVLFSWVWVLSKRHFAWQINTPTPCHYSLQLHVHCLLEVRQGNNWKPDVFADPGLTPISPPAKTSIFPSSHPAIPLHLDDITVQWLSCQNALPSMLP